MAVSNELMEAARTVAIALAVGFTGAAFGRDSPARGSSLGASRAQTAVGRMIGDLIAEGEGIANAPSKESVEI